MKYRINSIVLILTGVFISLGSFANEQNSSLEGLLTNIKNCQKDQVSCHTLSRLSSAEKNAYYDEIETRYNKTKALFNSLDSLLQADIEKVQQLKESAGHFWKNRTAYDKLVQSLDNQIKFTSSLFLRLDADQTKAMMLENLDALYVRLDSLPFNDTNAIQNHLFPYSTTYSIQKLSLGLQNLSQDGVFNKLASEISAALPPSDAYSPLPPFLSYQKSFVRHLEKQVHERKGLLIVNTDLLQKERACYYLQWTYTNELVEALLGTDSKAGLSLQCRRPLADRLVNVTPDIQVHQEQKKIVLTYNLFLRKGCGHLLNGKETCSSALFVDREVIRSTVAEMIGAMPH